VWLFKIKEIQRMSGTTRLLKEEGPKAATVALTRLNLIFHGPFVFLYRKKVVEVVTIANDEHVVGAGNWLDERPISTPGIYYLIGMQDRETAVSEPYPACHAVIDASNLTLDLTSVPTYRFVLPKPCRTEALARFEAKRDEIFVGTDVPKVSSCNSLGTAHLLSYELKENDEPQLDGVQWLPIASQYCPTTVNLHIYSEAPFRLDPDHPVRDFGKQMKLSPELSLDMMRPLPKFHFLDPVDHKKDLGLIREEQGGLRGLPPTPAAKFRPPLLCDAASLVLTNVAG
jgi:hypothetical protein